MPVTSTSRTSTGNQLLDGLPQQDLELLLPNSKYVELTQNQILHQIGEQVRYAYFPLSGMVSLLSSTSEGHVIEIAMVGNEGMIGVSLLLHAAVSSYDTGVQIPGEALRIEADQLKAALIPGGQLEQRLLRYVNRLFAQVSQLAVCNHFHTAEARLCRWLLVSRDRAKTDTLLLTQEIISHTLGTSRTVVTKAATVLADASLIRYRRGKITILNRQGLEAHACECYSIVKNQSERSFST
ncbi:MAG TPA: Crp/Fnr family transcriptional regulator [Pyrinomonadaceae bacterium]|nr:Crp/Fnr family transcriptional regulator [Pyrinomonadaceae bacterium]